MLRPWMDIKVPCDLRAPEDFLEWRYNLLDKSATRVIHYRLKSQNPARSRQHAWHSCRAGCIDFSENPQGLATHMVHDLLGKTSTQERVCVRKLLLWWIGHCRPSLIGRDATTYSRAVRWFVGCMKPATLIGGMQKWRGSWRLSPCKAILGGLFDMPI